MQGHQSDLDKVLKDKTGWSKRWISPYFKLFTVIVHVDKTNEK